MASFEYEGIPFQHGDDVSCVISGRQVDQGCVYCKSSDSAYICQNVYSGIVAPDLLGFEYSWIGVINNGIFNSIGLSGLKHISSCKKPRD